MSSEETSEQATVAQAAVAEPTEGTVADDAAESVQDDETIALNELGEACAYASTAVRDGADREHLWNALGYLVEGIESWRREYRAKHPAPAPAVEAQPTESEVAHG